MSPRNEQPARLALAAAEIGTDAAVTGGWPSQAVQCCSSEGTAWEGHPPSGDGAADADQTLTNTLADDETAVEQSAAGAD